MFTPLNAASLLLLPPDKVRMGSGLINILQQGVGGTVGLALMTTVLQRQTDVHTRLLDQSQAMTSVRWEDVLSRVQDVVVQAGDIGEVATAKTMALIYRHLLQQATLTAYQDCFILLAAMSLCVFPLVLFLRKR
jgi:DHA2 family multidrug resistance protein